MKVAESALPKRLAISIASSRLTGDGMSGQKATVGRHAQNNQVDFR